jgi:ABC-type nitrate/sulfonate/bicarbonate transport system ATPase subunit
MAGKVLVKDVGECFRSRCSDVVALKSLSFAASQGEFVAILGQSSCGTSTLLRFVAEFLVPDEVSKECSG